jgi:hypothetical protein
MFAATTERTLAAMTITSAPKPTAAGEKGDTVVLDGGLFLRRPPVVEDARRFAAVGIDVVVSLSTETLDDRRLTGVTRMLLEAAVEMRLREALRAAGYRQIRRDRDVPGVLPLRARA